MSFVPDRFQFRKEQRVDVIFADATRFNIVMDWLQNLGKRPLAPSKFRFDGLAHDGLDVFASCLRLGLELIECCWWQIDCNGHN